jgi:hypothetical protein
MFDSKFIVTLVGLSVALFAICKFQPGGTPDIVEDYAGGANSAGFGMNRVSKSDLVIDTSGGRYGSHWDQHKHKHQKHGKSEMPDCLSKGDFYSVPGTYQALLSPRMIGTADIGANIRYNLPPCEMQGVPADPLTFAHMAKENYVQENYTNNTKEDYGCNSCSGGVQGCRPGGLPGVQTAPGNEAIYNYTNGDWAEVAQQATEDTDYPDVTSMLPVADMTTVNADGEVGNPLIFNRLIYANRNSRLRSLGDPIRGDLPIVPCNSDWFRPSVHPSIDLREGALNVLAGLENEQGQALSSLIHAASGNTDMAIGGVYIPDVATTAQYSAFTNGGQENLMVTSFP